MAERPASQDAVIAFLSDPATYGIDGPVDRITTHISEVFLAGDRVYKLKRAVRFPYLDYSDIADRKRFCEVEVAVNRRTAPDLYLGAVAVTRRPDGGLALGGEGPAVDWLVEMKRFDQSAIWDALARRGEITPAMVHALADEIADFHLRAEPHPRENGASAVARTVDGIVSEMRRYAPDVFDAGKVGQFDETVRSWLARTAPLLDRRGRDGLVRHCHGDLHLRNICQIGDTPTLFDAIEFSDAIATIDVLYDLAFLLMDLEHRSLRPLGNLLMNRYLSLTDDIAGLAAMPMFVALRAGIRAHVTATAAEGAPDAAARRDEARAYLDLALASLETAPPRLIAIGGLSGSGKSTVARALAPKFAPVPGAVHLSSDVIRKRLAGVAPESRLDEAHYTAEVSERVYGRIRDDAAAALSAGYTAIADATYLDPAQRDRIAAVARDAGVDFAGLWLDVDAAEMERRLRARRGDASDADAAVLRRQMQSGPGELDWMRLDAGDDAATTAQTATRRLRLNESSGVGAARPAAIC